MIADDMAAAAFDPALVVERLAAAETARAEKCRRKLYARAARHFRTEADGGTA